MNEEAAAAKARDGTAVGRIYARNAVVTDAGCQSPGTSHSWTGLARIEARYRVLPRFSSIQHVNARVLWEPDDSRAVRADVTAETVGVIAPLNSSQKPQFIVGDELWTFALANGKWDITSFTYNLCRP